MKKLFLLLMVVALSGLFAISCKTTQVTDFSGVRGREWRLIEVQISDNFNREVLFNRKTMSNENAGDTFNLKVDDTRFSGKAAPNTYNMPYTLGENQSITLLPGMTTLMAPLFQPERLREHDFFQFMNNIYKWELKEGKLIFSSKAEDEREIQLIFE